MIKPKYVIFCLIMSSVLCSIGCTNMLEESKYSNFNYDPYNYWQAQPMESLAVPQYIADNLKVQPLYNIPTNKKLNGELKVKKTPPTLKGKIADYS